jgi:hypothetical protein
VLVGLAWLLMIGLKRGAVDYWHELEAIVKGCIEADPPQDANWAEDRRILSAYKTAHVVIPYIGEIRREMAMVLLFLSVAGAMLALGRSILLIVDAFPPAAW